jgi:hypothetical protein
MSEARTKSGRTRIIIVAVVLPLLYVLSSGPTQSLAFTYGHVTYDDDGLGNVGVSVELDQGVWWPKVYAPLMWIAEQSWGDWLCSYWQLFPVDPK